jgi:NADPH-dependent FMN reductase
VIGSTRPGRYADKAAGWMLKQTKARDDIEAELLDLRDQPCRVRSRGSSPPLRPGSVLHDEGFRVLVDGPRRREAAGEAILRVGNVLFQIPI